jgi:SAM-dependent methyltransferase
MSALAHGQRSGSESSRALWNERIARTPDASGTGCAGFGRNYNRWLYRLRAHGFRRMVHELPVTPARCRVLDVGSGTGFYLDQWRALGVQRLEALDFSEAAGTLLQRRHSGVPFHLFDLGCREPGLLDRRYDLISCIDVLFHLVDDEAYARAIGHLARWLAPGGRLLLSENFVHHEHPRVSDYHYSRTLGQIRGCLEAAGLDLVRRRPMFVLMNAPDDSRSRLLRTWWCGVSGIARHGERAGWLAGAALYPLDRLLTGLLTGGPTTEWALCRRVGEAGEP